MSKTYLPYDPDQQLLLSAALQEWLPDDHPRTSLRRGGPVGPVGNHRPLRAVRAGRSPYHPRMLVKVLLYGYCIGVASSRRMAQRLHEDIAFRVLAANNTPDFRTISDFRKDHLTGLFLQVLA